MPCQDATSDSITMQKLAARVEATKNLSSFKHRGKEKKKKRNGKLFFFAKKKKEDESCDIDAKSFTFSLWTARFFPKMAEGF